MVDVERFSPVPRGIEEKRPAPSGKSLESQVINLITLEVNIQKRVVELLTKVNELMTKMDKMVTLLERAGDVEETDLQKVIDHLKDISDQNEEILDKRTTHTPRTTRTARPRRSKSKRSKKGRRFSDL